MPKKHNPGGCCGCNPAPPCVKCSATEFRKNLRVQLSAGIAPANYEWDFEVACFPNTAVIDTIISQSYTHLRRMTVYVQLTSIFGGIEVIQVALYQEHRRYDLVNNFGQSLTQSERLEFFFRTSASGSCAHTRYAHFPCTTTPTIFSCSGVPNSVLWAQIPGFGWPAFNHWHLGYRVYQANGNILLGWPDPPIAVTAEYDAGMNFVGYHASCTLSWVDP